jgi:hypothetical protein
MLFGKTPRLRSSISVFKSAAHNETVLRGRARRSRHGARARIQLVQCNTSSYRKPIDPPWEDELDALFRRIEIKQLQ